MPLWSALLLGAVQGLTEFLPVSSSGHLALLQNFIDIRGLTENALAFDVVLHLGTLLSVAAAFREDMKDIAKGAAGLVFSGFKTKGAPERRLALMLALATAPLLLGPALEGSVRRVMEKPLFTGIALCFTAALLFLAEGAKKGALTEKDAPYGTALEVGFMQLTALFPGVSRSGATLCGGVFCGYEREFAVKFAFLLSVPAVLGAAALEMPEFILNGLPRDMLLPCAAGFLSSAVSGYLAIKAVRLLIKKRSLKYFGIYCVCAGLLTVALSPVEV
ncbi:MAG: undecaprenyl-diphosphate phosphatase [Clostridia bacterium]|nr:undecaprenyl-diphosphate phosphatase [Clostridia bacterium]